MDAIGSLRVTSGIRGDVSLAADRLLTLVEQGLSDVARCRGGDADAVDRIEAGLCAMLEACAFGDILGQRLAQLEGLLAAEGGSPADPLLNGPAAPGAGLDQAAADILMAAPARPGRPGED